MIKYLLLILLTGVQLIAQPVTNPKIDFSPEAYVCYKTASPINIDGRIDEQNWEKTEWTETFVDIEGEYKPHPRFQTKVKMLWDEKYFYIATELEEPDVWANLTERDAVIFYDNDFEVFIDPDGDTHEYYEFEMNALNTVWDLLLIKPYRDGGPAVNAWDIKGLKSAVHIDGTVNQPYDKDKGWTIEIAFPWDVLKECAHKDLPPKSGDQWRVNFSRVEWKTDVKDGKYQKTTDPKTGKSFPEDNWVWSPQGLINMHCPEMWGFVQFSDKLAGIEAEQFKFNTDENIKWALRQIYYEEKKYFEKNHKYTDDLKELGLTDLKMDGYNVPLIQSTSNLYEVIATEVNGKAKWHISQDGRTWKD
ncbi:MAG: carbohydrate-binding family 9-like protein [Ignavibacteriales bacterium]|nr:carbohydrate-binding family 9-like protein [Ignavibacteriales bacterium]